MSNPHITTEKFRADAVRKAEDAMQQAQKAAGFAELPDLKDDAKVQAIARICRGFVAELNGLLNRPD